MNAAPEAALKSLFVKSDRSSIGERPCRSINTKAGRRTTAAAKPPMTSQLSQPVRPPFESASTRPVSPTTYVLVPSRSRPRSLLRPDISCSTKKAQSEPSRPSGKLNQKTHGHEIATSAPPSTGPMTRPTAATIVFVPIARPSSFFGNASVTRAAAFAKRNAPPIPWRTRQRMSWVPLPRSRHRATPARRSRSRGHRRSCGRRGPRGGPR